LQFRSRMQDTGYRMQDTGCLMQDTGYRFPVIVIKYVKQILRPLRKVAYGKFTHPQPLPAHREGSISAPAKYCISCYWVWGRFSPPFSREGLGVGRLATNLVRILFGAGSIFKFSNSQIFKFSNFQIFKSSIFVCYYVFSRPWLML
jgi:hypothetical protein